MANECDEIYYDKFSVEDITPKFKVGDVVSVMNASRLFVIKEAIITSNRLTDRIIYEAAPLDNEDQLFHFEESMLEFQYHDDNWKFYFNESVRNGLPPWRGELYNYYSFYRDISTHGSVYEGDVKEYENDTLPPKRMEHILNRHTIYSRMGDMMNDANKKSSVLKEFHLSNNELKMMIESIQHKINGMNMSGLNDDNRKIVERYHGSKFTEQELQFISKIDELDKKDHYPVDMTNLQIMAAIKEAYGNAEKSGERIIQPNKKDDCSLPALDKGKILYRGNSPKYGLTIEFWYNFDLDCIESAYPIRKNMWF